MKKYWIGLCLVAAGLYICAVAFCASALTSPVFAVENALTVVIDAGHGGVDGGVSGRKTKVKESDVNLDIAMLVKTELEEAGFEVILTRKTGAGLYGTATSGFKKRDMQKRKEIIDAADPFLVVSVHQNYYTSSSVRGGQVFYDGDNAEGKRLAEGIQTAFNAYYEKQGGRARNAASGDYFILRCAPCPSVIAECGFLSNERDERILTTESGKRAMASCIVAGVLEYVSENAKGAA